MADETVADTLYERDFHAWTQDQARAIQRARDAVAAGRPNDLSSLQALDWDNLAEEIEALGRSERRELTSRIGTIIEHLTKLRDSTAVDPRRGWMETVRRERRETQALLRDSPSLARLVPDIIARIAPAVVQGVDDDLARWGERAPNDRTATTAGYTQDQILGDWWPTNTQGNPTP